MEVTWSAVFISTVLEVQSWMPKKKKKVHNDKAHVLIDQTSGELWLSFYSAHHLSTS